ncbi:MAG: acyl-CoA dehydrogenase family protein, partial [Limnohabitans sp.]
MDFDFSEDQEQLRDAVRKWVDKGYDFERRRSIVAAGGFDRTAYTELAELGLAGLYVSEDHGGLGMGPVEAMVVMEELGRGIVLEPLAQTLIASALLQTHAPAELQAAWLPRIAGGESMVVLAHIERGARHQIERCQAQAKESAGQWSVSATKSIVPVGDQADAFIVPAMAGSQMALFLIERSASGVHTQGYLTQDGARAAEVQFKNSPAQRITAQGLTALSQAADIGSACVCAEAVGVMDKTLAITAEYMNTRKQFGVPIASFQALRHRIADMKMQLELARAMSYYASLKLHA